MSDDPVQYVHMLAHGEARQYFCRSTSYFDTELPPYFNFEPLLQFCLERAGSISIDQLRAFRPDKAEGVNYTLLFNKDGDIGWRPFELMHPLIYAKAVWLLTEPQNWNLIQTRFLEFSKGRVECCSMPVASPIEERQTKQKQILNWWKLIEQRSLELSLEYSHVSLTDVSNCYPSIYTHAIAWAIHTREFAKKDYSRKHLGNGLDFLIRSSRGGQTNGIPQASLLSHICAELVLGYCDQQITENLPIGLDVKILRYRDDYRIFGNSDADCAIGLKVVSGALNEFGLRLGAGKTEKLHSVVVGAVKQDKIDGLELNLRQKTLQKRALIIHRFADKHPNSGALKFLLSDLLESLENHFQQSGGRKENATVIAAILLDIVSRSPVAFPAIATAISKIMKYLKVEDRKRLFELVVKRTSRIPNNGFMEVWLQRIAIPSGLHMVPHELLAEQVTRQKPPTVWNHDWIGDVKLRTALAKYSIVNRGEIDSLPPDIQRSEFDAFWNADSPSL